MPVNKYLIYFLTFFTVDIQRKILIDDMQKQKIMKFHFLFIILFFFSLNIFSQFYETGEVPFSQKYNQINTEHFKLVFPENLIDYATRMANTMEYSYSHITKSLNYNPKKVPVLLNSSSVLSNGYVSWAPKRMEVVTTPSRNNYSQEWMKELVLHESRHVIQIAKMNQGLTKIAGIGFGEMMAGGVTGMLPFWFLEGDAVCTETALSESGRGRNPSFQSGWRSILIENNKSYSYEKAYYGSFKDYIPDHYELGYQLTSYARNNYGDDIWDNVLNHVGRNPYQLYPFYFGLKKYAKSSKVKLYNETMDFLKTEWGKIDSEIEENKYSVINNTNKKVYTSYQKPIVMDNSFYIVEKSSLSDIKKIVIIDDKGNEKILCTPGYTSDNSISYANGKLIWDEIVYDPLWPKKIYSVIKVFDITSNKEKKLTSKSRYFHPNISSDGKTIVCVESDQSIQNYLVFLNAETGEILKKFAVPENKFPQYPSWKKDGEKIVMTLLGSNGSTLEIFNYKTEKWETLFGPTYSIISKPKFFKNTILFNGSFSGTDNIYTLNVETKKIFQITNSRFGAYDACVLPNENQLIYTNYTNKGYDLNLADYNPDDWIPLNQVEKKEINLYKNLSEQEGWKLEDKNIPNNELEIKKYNKLGHLINIHSWAPFYFDYDEIDFQNPGIYPGVQLFFQNLLSTSIGSLGYSYHDNGHYFNITYDYKGTRPAIQYSMEYGGDIGTLSPFDSIPATNSSNISNNLRLYLPIDLTNNRYSERFTPFVEAKFYNYQYYDYIDEKFAQGLNFIEYGMLYYRLLKQSTRDIRSKFGQIFQLNYVTSPNDNGNYGSLLRMYGTLYFPGLAKNHSIKLQGNYQKQYYKIHNFTQIEQGKEVRYFTSNYMPFGFTYPRGIQAQRFTGISSLSVDYAMPLLYPDLNIGRLAYIMRIRLNGFVDYSRFQYLTIANSNFVTATYYATSYGLDIISDMHLAHFVFPISIGIRTGFETNTNSPFTELLFEVDLGRY